jgi:Ice-binding-like
VRPVGAQHKADAVALQAKTDLATGYNDEAGQTPFVDKTGQDLGGQNLHPGVYRFSSSAQLTGTLTLNGQGNSSAVPAFQPRDRCRPTVSLAKLILDVAVVGATCVHDGLTAQPGIGQLRPDRHCLHCSAANPTPGAAPGPDTLAAAPPSRRSVVPAAGSASTVLPE